MAAEDSVTKTNPLSNLSLYQPIDPVQTLTDQLSQIRADYASSAPGISVAKDGVIKNGVTILVNSILVMSRNMNMIPNSLKIHNPTELDRQRSSGRPVVDFIGEITTHNATHKQSQIIRRLTEEELDRYGMYLQRSRDTLNRYDDFINDHLRILPAHMRMLLAHPHDTSSTVDGVAFDRETFYIGPSNGQAQRLYSAPMVAKSVVIPCTLDVSRISYSNYVNSSHNSAAYTVYKIDPNSKDAPAQLSRAISLSLGFKSARVVVTRYCYRQQVSARGMKRMYHIDGEAEIDLKDHKILMRIDGVQATHTAITNDLQAYVTTIVGAERPAQSYTYGKYHDDEDDLISELRGNADNSFGFNTGLRGDATKSAVFHNLRNYDHSSSDSFLFELNYEPVLAFVQARWTTKVVVPALRLDLGTGEIYNSNSKVAVPYYMYILSLYIPHLLASKDGLILLSIMVGNLNIVPLYEAGFSMLPLLRRLFTSRTNHKGHVILLGDQAIKRTDGARHDPAAIEYASQTTIAQLICIMMTRSLHITDHYKNLALRLTLRAPSIALIKPPYLINNLDYVSSLIVEPTQCDYSYLAWTPTETMLAILRKDRAVNTMLASYATNNTINGRLVGKIKASITPYVDGLDVRYGFIDNAGRHFNLSTLATGLASLKQHTAVIATPFFLMLKVGNAITLRGALRSSQIKVDEKFSASSALHNSQIEAEGYLDLDKYDRKVLVG